MHEDKEILLRMAQNWQIELPWLKGRFRTSKKKMKLRRVLRDRGVWNVGEGVRFVWNHWRRLRQGHRRAAAEANVARSPEWPRVQKFARKLRETVTRSEQAGHRLDYLALEGEWRRWEKKFQLPAWPSHRVKGYYHSQVESVRIDLLCQNIDSFRMHGELVCADKADIYLLQETRKSPKKMQDGTPIFATQRPESAGGGVAIVNKLASVTVTESTVKKTTDDGVEWIGCRINLREKHLQVVSIYIPPGAKTDLTVVEDLLTWIDNVSCEEDCIGVILAGDFNCNFGDHKNHRAQRLIDTFNASELEYQIVDMNREATFFYPTGSSICDQVVWFPRTTEACVSRVNVVVPEGVGVRPVRKHAALRFTIDISRTHFGESKEPSVMWSKFRGNEEVFSQKMEEVVEENGGKGLTLGKMLDLMSDVGAEVCGYRMGEVQRRGKKPGWWDVEVKESFNNNNNLLVVHPHNSN